MSRFAFQFQGRIQSTVSSPVGTLFKILYCISIVRSSVQNLKIHFCSILEIVTRNQKSSSKSTPSFNNKFIQIVEIRLFRRSRSAEFL